MGRGWIARAVVSTFALASVSLSLMCGPPSPPPIQWTATDMSFGGGETSAAFSPAATFQLFSGQFVSHPATALTQWNGGAGTAWAWSINGSHWNFCDVKGPSACGPGGGDVPTAVGQVKAISQLDWATDPNIAASPDGHTVVMSNLAHTTGQTGNDKPNGVAISTSIDGGQHFTKTYLANELNCMGHAVDQPALTADALVPNQYYITWRYQGTSLGHYGACGVSFTVNAAFGGTVTFASSPVEFDPPVMTGTGIGGMLLQERGDTIVVVYADTSAAANNCGGDIGVGWRSITSFDRGQHWPVTSAIASTGAFRTCLPDETTGVVQTGMRDFALAQGAPASTAAGTLFAAVPTDENLGFKIFVSGTSGSSWVQLTTVQIGSNGADSFFPALAVDDHSRVGLSFQALGVASTGAFRVTTWFAALEPGATAFVGPTPISGDYLADNPPPTGSCLHPLCSVGDRLLQGCDPDGCVTKICDLDPYCCGEFWSRSCAYRVGNLPGASSEPCNRFSCGGRTLGDFAGQTSIITASFAGVGATFLPAWTKGFDNGSGQYGTGVTASLVQVTP